MRLLPLLLALALLAPLTAGCLGEDDPQGDDATPFVASSAEEAGAVEGEAPIAPKDAYRLEADDGEAAVAYPVAIATTPAKAPVTLDFSGEFAENDCRPLNFGGAEPTLAQASWHRRSFDFREALAVGDVFSYNITLSYTNAPTNWAEIHPTYALGSTIVSHGESTQGLSEVLISWSGQGFRASDEDAAIVMVACEYAMLSQPMPYTLTVTLSFAEAAIPAEAPLLLTVPEGATRLFVRGLPLDPSTGVLSHFRIFNPDDTMLCECALSSNEEATVVELPAAGEYVILVDHTANGFVTAALDVPPTVPLVPLQAEWVETQLLSTEGAPVEAAFEIDLPRVPLFMAAFVIARDAQAGYGESTTLSVSSERGEVLRYAWANHVTFEDPAGDGTAWLGMMSVLGGEWEEWTDHHAFSPGTHQVSVHSEFLRGEIYLLTRQYVR